MTQIRCTSASGKSYYRTATSSRRLSRKAVEAALEGLSKAQISAVMLAVLKDAAEDAERPQWQILQRFEDICREVKGDETNTEK